MVSDPAEALALVEQTLEVAAEAQRGSVQLGDGELFRMLREAYHSIERSRPRRRVRDALAASFASQQSPAPTSRDG